jgi:RHS repeat-associated protein
MARFSSLASYKRSPICAAFLVIVAFLSCEMLSVNPAMAGIATATATGTITLGTDYSGVFGSKNASLVGKKFTLVVNIDSLDNGSDQTMFVGTPPYFSQLLSTPTFNPITSATMTINGITVSSDSHPIYNPYSDAQIMQDSGGAGGDTSIEFTDSYEITETSQSEGGFFADLGIYYNNPFLIPSYNWQTPINYSPANSAGLMEFSYTYTNYSVSPAVYQYAYMDGAVANYTMAASPKNNGGAMCPISTLAGDPINVGTGNLFETQTDFAAAPNTQLSFTRYYNSLDTSSAGLGVGWHSTYHRGLSATAEGVTVTRADGRQDIYTKNGSSYVADPDVTSVLTPVPATGTQTGWKLKLADDSTENYTLTGLLTSIVTRAGLTTTLTYNAANRLTTVTGPFGHKLAFTYDTSNRVSTMTVPNGGRFTYLYDGHDNLASVTHPDSTTRFYLYQNTTYPDLLTGLIDESGNLFSSWTYDSQGRATSSQHAGGANLTKVTYTNGTATTVTDARGNVHTYTLATQYNLLKPTAISGVNCGCSSGGAAKAFTYDGNGFISSMTDFNGNVTTYVHNVLGEETSRTEASGTALARTITTTWSSTFHLPTKIVEPNRTTTCTYDANGNLLTKSVTAGAHTRNWTYTYNTHGQVLTAKDPDNHVTTTTYDAKGDVATIKNALNQVTSFTSYDADGKVLSVTDPNGLVSAFAYDQLGRVLTKKVGTLKTSYVYAAPGMVSLLTLPDSSAYAYVYDAAHRLTQITDKAGDAIDYSYDATSNVTAFNVHDPGKTVTYTHSYTFDAGNRLASDSGATAAEKTTYVYDNQGNLLTRTDPLNHVSTYTYDALNRCVSFLDPIHNKTIYSYNENNDLTAVVDPRGLVTIYTYDGLDDQTGVTSPDTGATARTFDAAGNVLTSTDARAKVGAYTYDALNRPLTIKWTGGETIAYTYDTGTDGIGHLVKMTDPAGTTSFTYDQLGQMLTKSQLTGTVTLTVIYAYDAFGRMSILKYPSGKTITYSYDSSGRVAALSSGAGSIAYFPFGPAKSWTEPNGVTYARAFDKDGRINDIALGGTVTVQILTYDNASRVTGLTETGLGAKTYGYDSDDRLTGFVNGTATSSYTYDADGNRTSTITAAGTTTYRYSTTSNRLNNLSGLTTQTETYDASGNQISTGAVTFDYDARGHMSSAIVDGISTSYAINGLGERLRKTGSDVSNGAANEYIYDEQGHLLGEYNSTGGIVNETVYLADTPVAVLTGSGGATVYSLSADWLNTPHIIQNASKRDVWTWDHYAFGDNTPNQNPSGLGAFNYNLRFQGQHYDAEIGLDYNINRDYSSTLGRYVESDPIGLLGGINTYNYVRGNPIVNIDPFGLNCIARNGIVTCNVPGLDASVSFPQPVGWANQYDNFGLSTENSAMLEHHYDAALSTSSNCKEQLMKLLINNPTPGDPSAATTLGTPNNATPYPFTFNSPVISYLSYDSAGDEVVVNVTQPGHILFPGYVVRVITPGSAGGLTVDNYGEGWALDQSNWLLGGGFSLIWYVQTYGLIKQLPESCGCPIK